MAKITKIHGFIFGTARSKTNRPVAIFSQFTFKMRYIILCLWTLPGSKMANHQSSTIEKKVHFRKKRTFFSIVQIWWLAILEPVGVQRPNVPHFKGLIKPDWNQKRPRAWHHFYYGSRPLEKGHFTLKKGFVPFVLSRTVCTVVATSVLTRCYVKSENQLLLCKNLGLKNSLYLIWKP